MKKISVVVTLLLVGSILTACALQGTATPTNVPVETSTEEITVEPGTPEETVTMEATEIMSETGTPAADTTSTPDQADTPAPSRTPTGLVTLMVMENDVLGSFLSDSDGFTLYLFDKDSMNTSTCTGECADEWPPLLVSSATAVKVDIGLDMVKVGTIVRADGGIQVTYNGWPLYYFDEDEAPGDTNGQGQDDFFVISPAGEKIEK